MMDSEAATPVRAVLFDFDGTLTSPGKFDFNALRSEMGFPPGVSILDHLASLGPGGERERAERILEDAEARVAAESIPRPGAEDYIQELRARGVHIGIITRNSRRSVLRALENFLRLEARDFEIIVSRDDSVRYKPHPDGVFLAAETFGVSSREIAVVGDFRYDMEAARAAGSLAVFIGSGAAPDCDVLVEDIAALRQALDPILSLPNGKIPNHLLSRYFLRFDSADPHVLVRPGVGEDTAAISVAQDELIVVKSDPITFPSTGAARDAVVINANDIATSGADPRWFQCTLLFAPGTAPFQVDEELAELDGALRRIGISLTGGHTEITDAVTRTVVSGTLIGTLGRSSLLEKRRIDAGSVILMTGTAGIEGTAILCSEFRAQLAEGGMREDELSGGLLFRERLGIVNAARIARELPGVAAMHDVTEGGVAGAVRELSIAAGRRIRVNFGAVAVAPVTATAAKILGFNPLGLIGSGSLLIVCAAGTVPELEQALREGGETVSAIGTVEDLLPTADDSSSVLAEWNGRPMKFPDFPVDELARLHALSGRTNQT